MNSTIRKITMANIMTNMEKVVGSITMAKITIRVANIIMEATGKRRAAVAITRSTMEVGALLIKDVADRSVFLGHHHKSHWKKKGKHGDGHGHGHGHGHHR